MADPELGTKQVCPSCEAKFYDLNKRPAVCPKCGHSFDPEDEIVQATRTKVRTKAAQKAVPEDDEDDDDDEEETVKAVVDEDEDEDEDEAKELGVEEEDVVLEMSAGEEDEEATPGKVPAGFSEEGVDDDEDEDEDDEDLDLDDEFDLGDDLDLDDDNELGEPDADDIEPEDEK